MRRLLLAALAALALTTPATALANGGIIQIRGQVNAVAQFDPMEQYGAPISMHLHDAVGAAGVFSPTTTLPQMLDASSSTFTLQSDHSLLWFPTPMTSAGNPATIVASNYYLANAGYTLTAEPPNGLRVLGGNPHCTSTACAGDVTYKCATATGGEYVGHTIPTVADCAPGATFEFDVFGPGQCWDGLDYGPGFGGADGPGNDSTANFSKANPCPGYVVPAVRLEVVVGPDGLGGYLSSDVPAGVAGTAPGVTGHFNYMFGWRLNSSGGSALGALIQSCLNIPPAAYTNSSDTCDVDNGTAYKARFNGSLATGIPDMTQPVTN